MTTVCVLSLFIIFIYTLQINCCIVEKIFDFISKSANKLGACSEATCLPTADWSHPFCRKRSNDGETRVLCYQVAHSALQVCCKKQAYRV